VQTSALQERASALAVAKRLKAAGFAARVEGSEAPFRVRIGRYPTRAAAEAVAKRLRARKSPALVVEAGPR
jgi:cell division protein FtsN